MTYSAGSLIDDADYNGFATNINGVGTTLWGQTAVTTVAAPSTVTAAQWTTLGTAITNYFRHESGTNPSVTNPTAGQTINIIANLTTSVSSIVTNALNCAASGTQADASNNAGAKGSANTAWTATWTQTVAFASSAQRGYYFNAGGRIYITWTKTSTGTLMDPTWNSLVAACNQISFTSSSTSKVIAGLTFAGTNKQGGSGTASVIATTIGFAQLTTSDQLIFRQFFATYPYTGSKIETFARLSGNNVIFTTVWTQPDSGRVFEPVNISAGGVTTISQIPPATTYISASWGAVTLSSSVV